MCKWCRRFQSSKRLARKLRFPLQLPYTGARRCLFAQSLSVAFSRLIWFLFEVMQHLTHYHADVLAESDTWESHLEALERMCEGGFAIPPVNCEVPSDEVAFLGHRVGRGFSVPLTILDKIQQTKRHETKRQDWSFLPLDGCY